MERYQALQTFFGYSAFRDGQEELIKQLESGRDVLGILPTGGGKSLCYQIPGILTDGVTLSGGEPFLQAAECAALARIAREKGLNVWTYTGYTYEKLLAEGDPARLELLAATDVLVDGPFWLAEKSYDALFRGSRNQRLIDVPKSRAAGRAVAWTRRDTLSHFTVPES